MKTIFYLIFFILITSYLNAQSAEDLDFWIGKWKVEWKDSSGTHSGTNTIERILNNNVIKENFSAEGFEGKSFSVFNSKSNIWNQTWVDNSSGYLIFMGGKSNEGFIFSTERKQHNGTTIKLRMVFSDIKENSLIWDWQKSIDDGKNWKTIWRLNYSRLK